MRSGSVSLVGAGPGDPGLLTLRAVDRLRRADVVVHDRLVDPAVLDLVPPRALRIFVGKASGAHTVPQEAINALLIEHARAGRRVVRLKGGDPFVFGRGGEEADALAAAGVPCEVVPGVTSAVAVPAAAGIPLTHRDHASSFAVVTGHECGAGRGRIEWPTLATAVDTLVVLMGARSLPRIARRLLAHGRRAETPVALIESGTTRQQRTVRTTLGDLARGMVIEPPVIAVIGDVAALATATWRDADTSAVTAWRPVTDSRPAGRGARLAKRAIAPFRVAPARFHRAATGGRQAGHGITPVTSVSADGGSTRRRARPVSWTRDLIGDAGP